MSSHLTNIPEAVRIAASGDSSIDPALRTQALEYIQKVKELSEETWQDCLALYLQGAGAAGPSLVGKDGKVKLGNDLRVFCEQVVDLALIHKSDRISVDELRAMYDALVDFVSVEWVNGPCEGNLPFMRNKLAYTLTHLFVNTFPETITTFLHPFFALLTPPDPSSSKQNFHPQFLAMRLLSEISLEVHDTVIRATRDYTASRRDKDGIIRDGIRSTGDERLAVDGLLGLAQKGVEVIESGNGDRSKWTDVGVTALRTLASWIPWIDLSITLTPDTLSFYHRLLRQPVGSLRIAAANIIRALVAKKIKSPSERLQVLRILDIVSTLDPLEEATREIKDDEEIVEFRAAIGGILQQYGTDLITVIEHVGDDLMPINEGESIAEFQKEAENMMNAALPLLLSFLSDRQTDVPLSVNLFVVDILRLYKKWHVPRPAPPPKAKMPPPPTPTTPLTEERRSFLSRLLDICVRQLAWPDNAEWEPPGGEDPDPDDDMAKFWTLRMQCSNHIESISSLDKTLHTQIVASIVASTLNALQTGGASEISWQQAELALHLVYTFGELVKNNSIAAFFELPAEISSKAGRDRIRRISINKAHLDSEMSSGRTTPTSDHGNGDMADIIPGVYYGGKDKIDYSQFPLTTLGTLLDLCSTAGIVNYPHPSVPLMYFRIAVRYVEFWKAREGTIQPMFEAMLDQRGIHHPDETVRRRSFWEFTRFVRECKPEMNPDMAAPILQGMRDLLVIDTELPQPDTPDEDVLLKAATGTSYLTDQLHLFEAAGSLVYITRSDPSKHMTLLEAVAGPLMAAIGDGLQRPSEPIAVLQVHHYLMALGNFAKGFPAVSDKQLETLPYTPAFKQMTEALLEALNTMKTQRIVRDSARFAFSQFVSAIGSTIAELVPRFVSSVVTEFEAGELVDFILFLNLLMHRLKNNAFETMDMLLLPLLSRVFAVLRAPITGTDAANIHSRLKEAYLMFFSALMNANLDGVFITERNKPEFENVLSELLSLANASSDPGSQRQAIGFFARSITAWGSTNAPSVFAESAASELSKAVAAGTAQATSQHLISKEERAARAFPGYEAFIYQRLLPLCFEIPANPKFKTGSGINILHELATILRNTVTARGQEAIDYLLNDLLPKIQCPPDVAQQLVNSIRTQQSRDFRKTFVEFIKALRGEGKR